MLVLFQVLLLSPLVFADICCPPSRTYEGEVYSVLHKTTLKYAVDLDEQKQVMYSTIPSFNYFDYIDLVTNEAYEHFDGQHCYSVQPYAFGCIPTGAVQANKTLEEGGKRLRVFKNVSPFEQGHWNYTSEWVVDDDCVTVKHSLTFPFREPFEYYYMNTVQNITDDTVFDRNLTGCQTGGATL